MYLKTILFIAVVLSPISWAFGQDWWELDISGHLEPGSNPAAFHSESLKAHLHRDPKARNKDYIELKLASPGRRGNSNSKKLERERVSARMAVEQTLAGNPKAVADSCQSCLGNGFLMCSRCGGKSIVTCPLCENTVRHKCRVCDGIGVFNDNTCTACNGTGQKVCPSCQSEGRVPCPLCTGAGVYNCRECGGAGRVVVR